LELSDHTITNDVFHLPTILNGVNQPHVTNIHLQFIHPYDIHPHVMTIVPSFKEILAERRRAMVLNHGMRMTSVKEKEEGHTAEVGAEATVPTPTTIGERDIIFHHHLK
jgi:hypothetical protein